MLPCNYSHWSSLPYLVLERSILVSSRSLLYKLGCFIRIFTTEKNRIPHLKNYDNFTCVGDDQSSADKSLALFSAMNCLEMMKFLFECSTRYLTSKRSELVRYRGEHPKINSIP